MVGFVGSVVLVSQSVTLEFNLEQVFGDSLAIGAAIFMAIVYMNVQPVIKGGLPSGLVSMLFTGIATVVFFTLSCFFYTFDFDPETGVFGWLHPDNIVYCVFGVGLVNSIGNIGSYFTLKYLDVVTLG